MSSASSLYVLMVFIIRFPFRSNPDVHVGLPPFQFVVYAKPPDWNV